MATEAERAAFELEWRERFGNDDTVGMTVAWHFWQAALDYANRIVPDAAQQGIPAKSELLNKPQAYMVMGNGVCRGVYRVEREAKEIVTYCDGEFTIVPLYATGE